ncbi:hypothetical protein LNN86_26555 [Klebsiella pneumoniae subsp. pneumoniae]|nr:hypothetical protein [Klebsiella pneumoniae subsp. pneumoniae]
MSAKSEERKLKFLFTDYRALANYPKRQLIGRMSKAVALKMNVSIISSEETPHVLSCSVHEDSILFDNCHWIIHPLPEDQGRNFLREQ